MAVEFSGGDGSVAEAPFFVRPATFFAFRTPLLSWDEFAAWSEGLEAPSAAPEDLDGALARDTTRLRARLRAALARPEVLEALYVASPTLQGSLGEWERDPGGPRGLKVERSVVRYFARMCGRATPFGLFAGYSLGDFSSTTQLGIGPLSSYRRHTRLDMDYLSGLSDALLEDPEIRDSLIYRPNSSLHLTAGRIRYVEARQEGPHRIRTHHLVALEPTEALLAVLEQAQPGARLAELAASLVDDQTPFTEALEYVRELVRCQVFEPDLVPNVTGPDPAAQLALGLRDLPGRGPQLAATLQRAQQALAEIDAGGVGASPERHQAVARLLEALPAKVDPARLFQVDMSKPSAVSTLGGEVLDEIVRGMELCYRLAGPAGQSDGLARFRDELVHRYEANEVPLLLALDDDVGVGYESNAADTLPLLAGIGLSGGEDSGPTLTIRSEYLLRRLERTWRLGETVLDLSEEDFGHMDVKARAPLPDSFAGAVVIAAPSDEALRDGQFSVLLTRGSGGPSAARVLGRFCHADPRLEAHARALLRDEEARYPQALFAEIVHLPEGRAGNVINRPVLRDYEIPFLGRSGAPQERQIPVQDLTVSVDRGRIVLRSRRLDREVIPRLSNAHNFLNGRNVPVYRFLCDLQRQGVTGGIGWNWGPLESAPFLPRVSSGRVILALARWTLTSADLVPLNETKGADRYRAVRRLAERLRLPRYVCLSDGDNDLPVDLDNVLSVDALVHLIGRRQRATLVEMYPVLDDLIARGPEGRFVHEILIPFVTEGVPTYSLSPRPVKAACPVVREFAPGSEWLYAKLYTGTATADQVLQEVVGPVARQALARAAADRWFFVRYIDSAPHLRFRLHGPPARLLAEVLPMIHDAALPLLRSGAIWKIQTDTYTREVERYGGPAAMELAEQVFWVDSEAVLAMLDLDLEGDAAEARWRLALLGISSLFDDFGLADERRREVIARIRSSYSREFKAAGARLQRQLGEKYRKHRRDLELLLGRPPVEEWMATARDALSVRSERLRPIVERLRTAERTGDLTAPLADIVPSFAHMHADRLIRSLLRAQELVIYDLLDRHYKSLDARQRREKSETPEFQRQLSEEPDAFQ